MRAELLPDELTKVTAKDCARAFRSAFETVVGKTPSDACLALLVAQSALESGRWKSMHCWNFGNIKASPEYSGFYCQFRCNEVIDGRVQWFDPPHPQCNFRAFRSAEGGAVDHIGFLANRRRYAEAWRIAQTGDPVAFVGALKRAGYFTADEAPYRRAVTSLFNEYLRMVVEMADEPREPESDDALHREALAAMANHDPLQASFDERRAAMVSTRDSDPAPPEELSDGPDVS
jgi:hypothetical protein